MLRKVGQLAMLGAMSLALIVGIGSVTNAKASLCQLNENGNACVGCCAVGSCMIASCQNSCACFE
jgi:hypothetical protein